METGKSISRCRKVNGLMITSANKCKVVTLKLSSNKVTNSDLAFVLIHTIH